MKSILQRFAVSLCVIFFLLFENIVNAQITIVVNRGKFDSVEEAAISEEKVIWSDADLSDDRVCTESFAAFELANFLKSCESFISKDFLFASAKKLPEKGDVFILGSRSSNPLISSKILSESKEYPYNHQKFTGDKNEKARIIDDDRRFTYGEAMVYFYYHLVRTALFHRNSDAVMAKHEFLNVEKYAEILRNIIDLVAPIPGFPGGDANAKDGMEASQAENVYNYFKEKYGN